MSLLDLLFPPRCAGCRAYGSSWCAVCASTVERIPAAILGGVPLIAGGHFGGALQRAIHTYKYGGRPGLARPLSGLLLEAILRAPLPLRRLTFVPLHPERQRDRGFNQAERLAVELGRRLQIPVVGSLARLRPTPAQVGLSQAERQENMVGVFSWVGRPAAPADVAVVDDVCTTGATLEAAARAIRLAGGSVAAFLVLARAQTLPVPAVTFPGQSACP